MRLFNIDMDHIKDYFYAGLCLFFAWFSELIYVKVVSIAFVTFPTFREYLLDIKDIMGFLITAMTLIIVFVKLKRTLKNKK